MAMTSSSTIDVATIKRDFPLLMNARPNGKPVVYLDSASSSQKPQPVLDAMEQLYETTYANVHRGVYELGAETTERYEGARAAVARFIGARIRTRDHLHQERHRGHQLGGLHVGPGEPARR